MNEEVLLQEYLIGHPPYPFQLLVERRRGNYSPSLSTTSQLQSPASSSHRQQQQQQESYRGCSMVFREPGTLHYLVIETKYLCPTSLSTLLVFEYALRNGMKLRKRLQRQQQQRRRRNNRGGTQRDYVNDSNNGNCLIIAAMFTNEFGLQLVGHVEESSFEDVQFRIMPSLSSSSSSVMPNQHALPLNVPFCDTLQFALLQDLSISMYRWVSISGSWNMIGINTSSLDLDSVDGDQDVEDNLTIPMLSSLSKIVQRNNDSYSTFTSPASSNDSSVLRKTLTKMMRNERLMIQLHQNNEKKIESQQRKPTPTPTLLGGQSGMKLDRNMVEWSNLIFATTHHINNVLSLSSSTSSSISTIALFLSDAFFALTTSVKNDKNIAFHPDPNTTRSSNNTLLLDLCAASNVVAVDKAKEFSKQWPSLQQATQSSKGMSEFSKPSRSLVSSANNNKPLSFCAVMTSTSPTKVTKSKLILSPPPGMPKLAEDYTPLLSRTASTGLTSTLIPPTAKDAVMTSTSPTKIAKPKTMLSPPPGMSKLAKDCKPLLYSAAKDAVMTFTSPTKTMKPNIMLSPPPGLSKSAKNCKPLLSPAAAKDAVMTSTSPTKIMKPKTKLLPPPGMSTLVKDFTPLLSPAAAKDAVMTSTSPTKIMKPKTKLLPPLGMSTLVKDCAPLLSPAASAALTSTSPTKMRPPPGILKSAKKCKPSLSPAAKEWKPQQPIMLDQWFSRFYQRALTQPNQIIVPFSPFSSQETSHIPKEQVPTLSSLQGRMKLPKSLLSTDDTLWTPPKMQSIDSLPLESLLFSSKQNASWSLSAFLQLALMPPMYQEMSSLSKDPPILCDQRKSALSVTAPIWSPQGIPWPKEQSKSPLPFQQEALNQDDFFRPPIASSPQGILLEVAILLPTFSDQYNPLLDAKESSVTQSDSALTQSPQRILKSPKQGNLSIATSTPSEILKNRNKLPVAISTSPSLHNDPLMRQDKSPSNAFDSEIEKDKEPSCLGNDNNNSIFEICAIKRQLFTINESYSVPSKPEEHSAKRIAKRAAKQATSFVTAVETVIDADADADAEENQSDQKELHAVEDDPIIEDTRNILDHLFKDSDDDDNYETIVDKYNVLKYLFNEGRDGTSIDGVEFGETIVRKVSMGRSTKTGRMINEEVTFKSSSFIAATASHEGPTADRAFVKTASSDDSTTDRAVRTTTKTYNGDVAINLLCPDPYPYQKGLLPGSTKFQIRHETIKQRELRQRLEHSSYCQDLMNGRFIISFIETNNEPNGKLQLRIWKEY